MPESTLIGDAMKLVVGALLGFGSGWGAMFLKEKRERDQLHDALYREISDCYEAIHYHALDCDFLKTKLKNEMPFVAYESAAKNAAALYRFPEHGWIIGCYREVRKLADLSANTNDQDLVKTVRYTLAMIENVPDLEVKRRLDKFLPPEFHNRTKAQGI